jgi:hypothetical protein
MEESENTKWDSFFLDLQERKRYTLNWRKKLITMSFIVEQKIKGRFYPNEKTFLIFQLFPTV